MSTEQLDRLERKINRIGNFMVFCVAVAGVSIVIEVPQLSQILLSQPWLLVGAAALGVFTLYLLWRPFRP